jgi:hypothetical protein
MPIYHEDGTPIGSSPEDPVELDDDRYPWLYQKWSTGNARLDYERWCHGPSPEDEADALDAAFEALTLKEKAIAAIHACVRPTAPPYIRLQAAKIALELEKKEPTEDKAEAEFRKIVTQLGVE